MLRQHKILLGFLFATAIWAAIWALESDLSAQAEICEYAAGQKDCSSHNILFVLAWKIAKAIDHWSVLITALATGAVAYFTGTIWKINRSQLIHSREVERAYLWGGGSHDKKNPEVFVLTVNNYGKTPGLLTEFAIGFCSRTNVPATPEYLVRETFHDWIPPIHELIRPIAFINIPPIADPLIYGRFWFQDIWGSAHSIGFILVTVRDSQGREGTSGIIPREVLERISPAYTNWDQTRREDQ